MVYRFANGVPIKTGSRFKNHPYDSEENQKIFEYEVLDIVPEHIEGLYIRYRRINPRAEWIGTALMFQIEEWAIGTGKKEIEPTGLVKFLRSHGL